MTKENLLILLLIGLTSISCNNLKTSENTIASNDTINSGGKNKSVLPDQIAELLEKAKTSDTLEFNNQFEFKTSDSFLYFKSGHFIDQKVKHAIVATCPTDSTYNIVLYSFQLSDWKAVDSFSGLDAFPPQFCVSFNDYNFDNQTDIYIQVSSSNGWPLSRGHLITLEPKTLKFKLHNETRDLANMTPDNKTKSITTELWEGYDLNGVPHITLFKYKWVNGRLKMVSKETLTVETEK